MAASSSSTTTATADENQSSEEPLRFSWCVDEKLSACAFPGSKGNLQYLHDNNIRCLVSLTEERKVDTYGVDIKVVEIPVTDYNIPSMEQVEQFLQAVKDTNDAGKGACVHCAGGRGRTGVMLACYLVQEKGMTAPQAVDHVREQRPGSIETPNQELFIYQFVDYLAKKGQQASQE